nr:MAG TPA_asm: hypothetical protein [Caudoviricetes sp.]
MIIIIVGRSPLGGLFYAILTTYPPDNRRWRQ